MDDFEELDSFTQDIVRKTLEREKLLKDLEDSQQLDMTCNVSNTSLNSDIYRDSMVSDMDNKSDIMSNSDNTECVPPNDSKSILINKLITISPDRKRVPLNQRLSSIARSYYSEDTENMDYFHREFDDIKDGNERREDLIKAEFTETEIHNKESQPKKRLLLNERLNAIARKFDDEELDVENDKTEYIAPIFTPEESELSSSESEILENSSNLTENVLQTNEKSHEMKSDFPEKLNVSSDSPLKKKLLLSDEKDFIQSNGVKLPISENNIFNNETVKKNLFHDNSCDKIIFNSNNNIRQSVEEKMEPKTAKPENLSIKAKKDLFEKAILAENEAKSKQYGFVRKRIAPQQRIVDNPYNNSKKEIESKSETTDETSIKRVKSSEKLSPNKNVSINIKLLEQRLFATESSTADSVMKDIENRKKELEILKHPIRQINDQYSNQTIADEYSGQQNNDQSEDKSNIDKEIIDVEKQSLEKQDHYIFCSNNDKKSPILKSSWSTELELGQNSNDKSSTNMTSFQEIDGTNGHESQFMSSPPPKPRRLYDASDSNTPLRTISFYRREQSHNNSTPDKQMNAYKEKEKICDLTKEMNEKINERIEQLKEEVDQQICITGQASQALNLCFERRIHGSTEHIEAERLLLVSGQKRIACLNEISRLKVLLSNNVNEIIKTKVCLALHNIQLHIKGKFLVPKVSEIHNFICLIYNGANVHLTDILNSKDDIRNGKLDFSVGVYLKELSKDFTIRIHVYDLIIKSRDLSHDIKYHIKKKTPKKNKKGSMKSPSVRSPGGPNAVLSTSFSLIGAVNISLSNYSKKSFKLENLNIESPLEGELLAQTELNVEHIYTKEGFFDIRDGTGFWNLRWFVLKGHHLGFWRSPEDVNTKPSLGSIDLKNCINQRVSFIPSSMKHICLRPNAIALITSSSGNQIKYLISGVNREECSQWCELLTKVLENIRLWESDSAKPNSDDEFNKLLMTLE